MKKGGTLRGGISLLLRKKMKRSIMMISIIAGFMLASTDAFPEKDAFSNKEAVFENYEGGVSKSEAI